MHLAIPVWTNKGWGRAEHVEAREIAPGRYEITCPPRFASGLAVGDEIVLDGTIPEGFRVVRHSRNLTIWVFCTTVDLPPRVAAESQARLPRIRAVLEGTPPRMAIITAPLDAGWSEIKSVMEEIVSAVPGTSWEYGNVYRPQDGTTPLDWWRAR